MATASGLIDGLERHRVGGDGVDIDLLVGGTGPPLLLLHGFPQTRVIWQGVARELLSEFTLVVPDLRGYGRSDKPDGGDRHKNYSKRAMAADQIAVMENLGFSRFAVAGHDRGGRVAYRAALDHPERVGALCVIDIQPTGDLYDHIDADEARRRAPLFFHMLPGGLPERLIGNDAEFYVRWTLGREAAPHFVFDADNMADYVANMQDDRARHTMLEEMRASWTIDYELDVRDRGVRAITVPVLVLWGDQGAIAHEPNVDVWRRWANDVRGHSLPSGHYVPEEAPLDVAEELRHFLRDQTGRTVRGAGVADAVED